MPPAVHCDVHVGLEQTPQQRHDLYRGPACSRGYDRQWRNLQDLAMRRDKHTCVFCLRMRPTRVTPATVVHHIKPVAEYPYLRLVLTNLVSLCVDCHKVETGREIMERSRGTLVREP
jgi:5-methylcytosine-specific restriction endonuclease McrA